MSQGNPLPSWREGTTRSAILEFVERSAEIPVERRVAVFDNDGTLWCEKPNYPQLDFFVHELKRAATDRPEMAKRPEYAAILGGDRAAMGELGLERIALALVELFVGLTPEDFAQRASDFVMKTNHPKFGVTYGGTVYQPMLELLDHLRANAFSVFIVSGGGTEFVRAVSRELYGVDPEGVVGTLVTYEFVRQDGAPVLLRTGKPQGVANEGPAKISNIQAHLGRRPILAGGNSAGDTEMLEYAAAAGGAGLALLVDHDDAEREYSYASVAGTFAESEPIRETAKRLGWTVVSMREDWTKIFPDA